MPLVKVPVPSVLVPFLKVTVPLGVPAPGETGLTVAVKVTDWPKTEGLAEEVKAVAVEAMLTTWLTAVLVLELKLESPAYSAVML